MKPQIFAITDLFSLSSFSPCHPPRRISSVELLCINCQILSLCMNDTDRSGRRSEAGPAVFAVTGFRWGEKNTSQMSTEGLNFDVFAALPAVCERCLSETQAHLPYTRNLTHYQMYSGGKRQLLGCLLLGFLKGVWKETKNVEKVTQSRERLI